MCFVVGMRSQSQFRVTGELQAPAAERTVGHGKAPQLHVVFDRHGHLHDGFNARHTPVKLGAIRGKACRTRALLAAERLIGGRPGQVGAQIPNVQEAAPLVESRVRTPARQIEFVPTAVSAAGVRHHQRIASIALEVHARNGSLFAPGPLGRLLRPDRPGRRRPPQDIRAMRPRDRNAFEQKRFDGADAKIAMEAPLHDVAVQHVIHGQQTHALVVSHVCVDHHAMLAVPFSPAAEINRLVETHGPGETEAFETPQIVQRGSGIDRQRQHGGVRRDDEIVFEARSQRQCGHSKSPILIDLVCVERAVGGFGSAPGQFLLAPVADMLAHRFAAGVVKQRIGERAGEQVRHQVLEHRAAPGQQNLPAARIRARAGQGKPVLDGHIAFRNRDQTGQPAFAGEQVVMARKLDRTTHRVADAEQPPVHVVQETHVDAGCKTACILGQGLEILHDLRRIRSCARILGGELIEPCRYFGWQVRPSAMGQNRIDGRHAVYQSEKRRCGVERAQAQVDHVVSKLFEKRIRRVGERLHPPQVSIDCFRPGGELARQVRCPIKPFVARIKRPVPRIAQLLDRAGGQPKLSD